MLKCILALTVVLVCVRGWNGDHSTTDGWHDEHSYCYEMVGKCHEQYADMMYSRMYLERYIDCLRDAYCQGRDEEKYRQAALDPVIASLNAYDSDPDGWMPGNRATSSSSAYPLIILTTCLAIFLLSAN